MPSDRMRLQAIVDGYAVPTPVSPNGLTITLHLKLYAGGHAALVPMGSECNDRLMADNDMELMLFIEQIVQGLRQRQRSAEPKPAPELA